MKLSLLLMIAWLSCCTAMAQKDSTRRSCSCSFSSINQVGLLSGEADAFQFQSINGLRFKSWFAGIGLGLDMYPTSGIPVFFDLRKDLLNKKNTPYVYADAGVHVAKFHSEQNEWQATDYNNGLYYDAGAGYKFGLPKRGGILLSIGFSRKEVEKSLRSVSQFPCDLYPCNEYVNRYHYTLNRMSFKAGWQF